MRQVKYNYEDINRNIVLLDDVADIENYNITLPENPKPEFIGNFGLPKEQQYFQKERIPVKIWQINKQVNSGEITREQALNLVKKDSDLKSFVESQWRKREFGDWQYIYGKAYYLTPTYWFFLNYYQMDLSGRVGLPSFRVTQWEKSLWWKFSVEDNEAVFGGIDITRRREGKTYFSANVLVEYATKTIQAYCGIQSKNEDDAKKYFSKAVMFQLKRIPFYFLPEHERFSKQNNLVDFSSDNTESSFESMIDYKSTTATAYDGQKLGRWVGDEFGKLLKPANPIEIWDKNKYCFFDDGRIIGKALITSTVEEMSKGGGEEIHTLWNWSSRQPKDKMINEFNETRSGLVPFFTSAIKNMFHDQYGIPIVETPLPHQAEWRKAKKDRYWNVGGKEYVEKEIASKTGAAKQDQIRKMPPTIKDLFRYNNTQCLFDIGVLNDRITFFDGSPYPVGYNMTFGYFSWVPGQEWKAAQFNITDQESARCHVRMLPLSESRNKWYIKNGKQTPQNIMRFNMGCDPFKMNIDQVARKDRASDGAGHVYALFDPAIDPIGKPRELWLTDNLVLEYLYRPATPDMFAEDMAMIAVFYGCKIFPEANIGIVDKIFREHGLSEYLQFRWKPVQIGNIVISKEDKKMAGAYTTELLMPTLVRHGINYVLEKGIYCPFPRTLEQLRDLRWDTLKENDAAASVLYTLMGTFEKPPKQENKNAGIDYRRDIGIPELTFQKRN